MKDRKSQQRNKTYFKKTHGDYRTEKYSIN